MSSKKKSSSKINSIRAFDSAITAPRWGFANADIYYKNASPFKALMKYGKAFPKTLIIQSLDDPWVPSFPAQEISNSLSSLKKDSRINILITSYGGHNGFHGIDGCWGDRVVTKWLESLIDN